MIVEHNGKESKTLAGVLRQFCRLSQHEPTTPQQMRDFILRADDFKAIADYATLPPPCISLARVASAIQTAEQFVATVMARLPPWRHDGPACRGWPACVQRWIATPNSPISRILTPL